MNSMPRLRRLRFLAGWLVLLAMAAVQTPVLPLCAAVIGSMGGGHAIDIRCERGHIAVALRHDRSAADGDHLPAGHRHSGLTRLIAGTADSPAHPDHLLTFHSLTTIAETDRSAESHAPECPEAISSPELAFATSVELPTISENRCDGHWWPPVPCDCEWGRTVLLL